jgi:16S rRNA (cytosine967-C5)-methyltransferase
VLAYATCSLLVRENALQIDRLLAGDTGWQHVNDRTFSPLDGGDGFYLSVLRRA